MADVSKVKLINGTEYNIKDTSARNTAENVVLVQDIQPTTTYNKLWIKTTAPTTVSIPTMADINTKIDKPSVEGTSGQVLTSDGNGGQSWQTPSGGGSGGTTDYTALTNKPSINGVTLSGNKTLEDIGTASAIDVNWLKSINADILYKTTHTQTSSQDTVWLEHVVDAPEDDVYAIVYQADGVESDIRYFARVVANCSDESNYNAVRVTALNTPFVVPKRKDKQIVDFSIVFNRSDGSVNEDTVTSTCTWGIVLFCSRKSTEDNALQIINNANVIFNLASAVEGIDDTIWFDSFIDASVYTFDIQILSVSGRYGTPSQYGRIVAEYTDESADVFYLEALNQPIHVSANESKTLAKWYLCLNVSSDETVTTASKWRIIAWTNSVVTSSQIVDLDNRIDLLEKIETAREFTPAQLQEIAARGLAAEYFSIGDIIYIDWTDKKPTTPVTYKVPHVVVHIGDVYDANNVKHEGALWLMWMYATPQAIPFDAAEAIVETESTFQSGYYYYTKNADNSFTEQTVTAGNTIPSGATYYKHVRTGMAARLRYGSNDWSESAYRQWLNSAGGKGGWWTAQHESDVAPSEATNTPGFLTGYSDDWLAIFKPVKVVTALNTACDEGRDVITYDKFFLPSLEQMYGEPQKADVEGAYWEYWKEETGYDAPTNGSASNVVDARKIPSISAPDGASFIVRLRSAYRSATTSVWYVYTAGYINLSAATTSYRAQPACVIY